MQYRQISRAQAFRSSVAYTHRSSRAARTSKPQAAAAAADTTTVNYRIRRVKVEDSQAVADLYSEVELHEAWKQQQHLHMSHFTLLASNSA